VSPRVGRRRDSGGITVVTGLENLTLTVKDDEADVNGKSVVKEEFDDTTKIIGANLSNFFAWHNRTKLASRILEE
jgi:geranylgeranyl transferase type-2 subunit alpha